MCRDVVRAQSRESLELDDGLPAIEAYVGIALTLRDIAMALEI